MNQEQVFPSAPYDQPQPSVLEQPEYRIETEAGFVAEKREESQSQATVVESEIPANRETAEAAADQVQREQATVEVETNPGALAAAVREFRRRIFTAASPADQAARLEELAKFRSDQTVH